MYSFFIKYYRPLITQIKLINTDLICKSALSVFHYSIILFFYLIKVTVPLAISVAENFITQ